MNIIKFRRPHFRYKDSKFHGFSYWGPVEDGFDSPAHWLGCKHEDDQQYTGRKDSKEEEIYEGSILSAGHQDKPRICEVYWNEEFASFHVRHKPTEFDSALYIFLSITKYTNLVIGNVQDNPELLITEGGSDGET